MTTFDVSSHCGEYCELDTTDGRRLFGQLLRIGCNLFAIRQPARPNALPLRVRSDEIAHIIPLRPPHY